MVEMDIMAFRLSGGETPSLRTHGVLVTFFCYSFFFAFTETPKYSLSRQSSLRPRGVLAWYTLVRILRIFFISCITLLFLVRIPRNPYYPPYGYQVSPYYLYIKYFWNLFLYYNLIQRLSGKEYNGTLLAIKALLPYLIWIRD